MIVLGTFDNFNSVVVGVKGTLAFGIDMIYNTLLVSSLDEVSSVYGLLAEAVSYPDDFSSATYRLRPEAKWNDGKPVTPDDVVFSFNSFKKLSPMSAASFRQVVKAEKTGDRDVTFTFQGTGNSELPHDRRTAHDRPQALVGGHRQQTARSAALPRPRSSRRSAAALTASRSLLPATASSTSASPIIGARISTSISVATISASCASNISAMRPSPSKPSRPTPSTGATRTAPRTGPPPTIFPRSPTSASCSRNSRSIVSA